LYNTSINEIKYKNMAETEQKEPKKMRQIIIETDGDVINLVKAEVGGKIELVGVLQNLIGYLNKTI
jgi:hypothetical protein